MPLATGWGTKRYPPLTPSTNEPYQISPALPIVSWHPYRWRAGQFGYLFVHWGIFQLRSLFSASSSGEITKTNAFTYYFPRFTAIVFRCAPGLGTSTRRRCRSGDASAPTAVIPAALAATVAITQQSKR